MSGLRTRPARAGPGATGSCMRGMRDWLDVLLATIGTGVVVGAVVALLAGLIGEPSTVVVGMLAGVASGVATLFVAGAVVSVRRR